MEYQNSYTTYGETWKPEHYGRAKARGEEGVEDYGVGMDWC